MTLAASTRVRPADVLAAIGGPYALSWQVAVLSYPLTILTTVWIGWTLNGSTDWRWFLAATVAQVAMVLAGLPVRLTVLHAGPRPSRPVIALLAFVWIGVVRGATLIVVTRALGIESGTWLFRLVGGPILMVVILGALAWGVDSNERYRLAIRRLSETRDALRESRDDVERVLQRERLQLIETITRTIRVPLQELHVAMARPAAERSSAASSVVDEVHRLLDEAVKPLSRAMASNTDPWQPAGSRDHEAGAVPRMHELQVSRPLYPLAQALAISSIFPVPAASVISVPSAVLGSIAIGLGVFAVLWLGDRAWQHFGARRLAQTLVVLMPLHLLAGCMSIPVAALLFDERRLMLGFSTAAVAAIVTTGVIVTVASAVHQQRLLREEELRGANAELAVAIAQLSAELWTQRRHVAHVLHGDVQSGLIAAAARMAQGQPGEALIEPVEQALDRLAHAPVERPSMERFLEELSASWQGVADLASDASDEALEACRRDAGLSSLVQALVQELVSNAVRHGQAAAIDIVLEMQQDAVRLTVADDGVGFQDGRPGLGTRMIASAARAWGRNREGDLTIVWCELSAGTPVRRTP